MSDLHMGIGNPTQILRLPQQVLNSLCSLSLCWKQGLTLAQADLGLIAAKIASNSQHSCCRLLSVELTGDCHHTHQDLTFSS